METRPELRRRRFWEDLNRENDFTLRRGRGGAFDDEIREPDPEVVAKQRAADLARRRRQLRKSIDLRPRWYLQSCIERFPELLDEFPQLEGVVRMKRDY